MGKLQVREELVYKVVTNSDLTEGRGGPVTIGLFTNLVSAEAAAKGQGVMGTDAEVSNETCTVVVMTDGKRFLVGQPVHTSYEDPEKSAGPREMKQPYMVMSDEQSEALAKLVDAIEAVAKLPGRQIEALAKYVDRQVDHVYERGMSCDYLVIDCLEIIKAEKMK